MKSCNKGVSEKQPRAHGPKTKRAPGDVVGISIYIECDSSGTKGHKQTDRRSTWRLKEKPRTERAGASWPMAYTPGDKVGISVYIECDSSGTKGHMQTDIRSTWDGKKNPGQRWLERPG